MRLISAGLLPASSIPKPCVAEFRYNAVSNTHWLITIIRSIGLEEMLLSYLCTKLSCTQHNIRNTLKYYTAFMRAFYTASLHLFLYSSIGYHCFLNVFLYYALYNVSLKEFFSFRTV